MSVNNVIGRAARVNSVDWDQRSWNAEDNSAGPSDLAATGSVVGRTMTWLSWSPPAKELQNATWNGDQLQLHLIELSKYDICEGDLSEAECLEKWVFFFTDAHKYDADQLRRLLPEAAYQKATETLEMIAREPDLRLIYD